MWKAAHVAPDLVFPVIRDRFEKALESVTSTHLLASAIHTLALCVRPLLVAAPSYLQTDVSGGAEAVLTSSFSETVVAASLHKCRSHAQGLYKDSGAEHGSHDQPDGKGKNRWGRECGAIVVTILNANTACDSAGPYAL